MGFTAIVFRDLRMLFSDHVNLFFAFLAPLVYTLLYATSVSSLIGDISYNGEQIPYRMFMIGGVLTITALTAGVQVANSVFSEVSSGSGLEIWSAPISTMGYLFGRLFAICAYVAIQVFVMLAVGLLVAGYRVSVLGFLCCLVAAIIGAVLIGSMLLYVSFFIRAPNRFMLVLNIFQSFGIFAAPIFYNRESMPVVVSWLSMVNPLTYVVDVVRSSLFLNFSSQAVIALAMVVAFLAVFVTLDAFRLYRIRDRL